MLANVQDKVREKHLTFECARVALDIGYVYIPIAHGSRYMRTPVPATCVLP